MSLQIITAQEVRALLPMDRCIALMREAMALEARGGAVQPIRSGLQTPDRKGGLGVMPGHIANPAQLGVKVVTVFPGNHGTALGSHQGMVILFEADCGRPTAIVEARALTAVRTAAASAAASDVLANKDAATLAVLGCGDQAAAHLEALALVRDFQRTLVWGRDQAKAEAFAAAQSARLSREIGVVASVEQAAAVADVICTTTAAAEPVLKGAWLHEGQHLNVVGSSIPTTAEIDAEAVARSRYFVDFEASARALAGDFLLAVRAGAVGEDHLLGSVGQVITGALPGRTAASDITLFKSLGMIGEDIIAADFVVREAARRGIGTTVDW
jgi:ornithine cyclodeaminase